MRIIGLTGGIAAGKSTVSERWASLGGRIVDADLLAREAVDPGSPGLAAVVDRFGPSVLREDGSLDRPALGAIVFGDDAARSALNAIVHPEVWRLAQERFAATSEEDPDATIVYDVPLLVEANQDRPLQFDSIVVVHAPATERIRRLEHYRAMSHDDAVRRVRAQASDEERLAVADYVVDASGTLDDTLRSADDVWHSVTARA